MDGSAARGASPCSPTLSRSTRHRSPVQSDRADASPASQGGEESRQASRQEGPKVFQEGGEEDRQEVGQEGCQEGRQEDCQKGVPSSGPEEGKEVGQAFGAEA